MPAPTELSRRGLFTFGLSRLREQAVSAAPLAAPAETRAQRLARARRGADPGDLWDPVRRRLDAVAGPLPPGTTSLFGPMFSTDHGRALQRMFDAAGPGGTIAFTAWTPLGAVGRLLRLAATLDPAPAGRAPASTWGREERLRQDLERWADDPELLPESIGLRFASTEDALERLCRALPPLAAVPDQEALRTQATAVIDELAAAVTADDGDGIVLPSRYLVALATRRGD